MFWQWWATCYVFLNSQWFGALEASCVSSGWPSPRGLLQGLASVVLGQLLVFGYYVVRRVLLRDTRYIQYTRPPPTTLAQDLWAHLSAPGSFLMMFLYLASVWMLRVLPAAYYDLAGSVSWWQVALQFVVNDFFTYVMHRLEHAWPSLYKYSHKPHHHWMVPKLYNAFNGHPLDTFCLILIPLFFTHQVCYRVNTWTFMAFGTLYAAQFTLIHCEWPHPWDPLFQAIGLGTAEDHSIHHALFNYNYGHFTMYYDWLFGTYKAPSSCNKFRSSHAQDAK